MRRHRLAGIVVLSMFCPPLMAQAGQGPPVARQVEHISVWHGEKVNDPFFWLREKSNPRGHPVPGSGKRLHRGHDQGHPAVRRRALHGNARPHQADRPGRARSTRRAYSYYSRTRKGSSTRSSAARRRPPTDLGRAKAAEEVLLDLNELAKGFKFLSLGAFDVSDDANLLAYTIDTTGFRQYRLCISRTCAPAPSCPTAPNASPRSEWCSDNRTLFYTTEDPVTKRSNMVWRHMLGDETEPVYQEKDRLFNVRLGRSKDKKMLFLALPRARTPGRCGYLTSDQPQGTFQVVLPREKGHKYSVEHRDGLFYLRTNRDAKNFRLVTAPVSSPSPPNWKELLPHRADVLLEGVELFQGLPRCRPRNPRPSTISASSTFAPASGTRSAFPRASTPPPPRPRPSTARGAFRFSYQSMITPDSVYDYDMATGSGRSRNGRRFPASIPTLYATERQWAVARDGVKVPLSIVYRKGVKKDGSAPLFLYGYGSYGSRHAGRLQQQSPEPAGSGHGLRHRPHPRRQRDGRGLARRRHAHEEEKHLSRLHRQRPVA